MKPGARKTNQRRPQPGWFAHPVLSLLLAAAWLLLQQSVVLPHLITAAMLGLGLPRLLHGFIGEGTLPRKPMVALRFAGIVLWDIVVSNLTVARIVLSPRSDPRPAWVRIPLEIRHPNAIVLLAAVITTTPGTVSCVVDDERHEILVHALDCDDPAAMAEQIKQRYEKPLKEILG
jgi:multicomponent K+:H+ antiporter subunit E